LLKKTVAFIIVLISFSFRVYALDANDISAECAVIITAQSGEVIFAKEEHKKHSMASTTKIMTSLLAVESEKLEDEIKVTGDMLKVEGTSMGLMAGDSVSLEELCYGMLLPSGNDAANVSALYLGGSLNGFAEMMNLRAKQIGMKDTNFVTPSGLDDDNHYSTAYDMALLGREAVGNPFFLKICSSTKATLTYGNPPYARTLYNHNRLLNSYDYVLGIKTGFTKKSGRCLVTYAEKDGTGLIVVTLNDPNDWYDHITMLDYGFSVVTSSQIKPEIPGSISVVGGNSAETGLCVQDVSIESNADDVRLVYYLPRFVYAPVSEGDVVGSVDVYVGDRFIQSITVTAKDSVGVKKADIKTEKKSILQKIKEIFHD